MQACVLTNCTRLSTLVRGGGIYQTNGILQMKDCTISNCKAADQDPGGGIFSTDTNSVLRLTNTRIEECNRNTIQSDGSAICASGLMIINDSIITRNPGCHGGGIAFGSGNLFVTNTIITVNSASFAGG